MRSHILVDYHNLPLRVVDAGVAQLASTVDSLAYSIYPDTEETTVRLYGGWYDHSGLSNQGTRVTQEINRHFPLPLRRDGGKIRYVRCEIASSLVSLKAELFFATVRQRRGMDTFLRGVAPPGCIDTANCTIPTVLEWSRRKGCPTAGCPVRTIDAFVCNQQKLVDTLMCCDLITLASAGSSMRLFLVSEDDDLIPALLLARAYGANVWHVRTKASKGRLYDAMLRRQGVQIASL